MTPGIVQGKLFHIADRGYPALLEGTNDVYGEIMAIQGNYEEILKILDDLECFYGDGIISNEYDRKKVDVLNIDTDQKEQLSVYFLM
ncbi:gamma-glutamylcyclotransferase [Brevinema andersonii]|uniref:gamma-glutamylcyclotransferase n=1 Tax=Brevinema andersonii TaxID=34097 RepID=UPI000B8796D0|nr:gamma-glutamylcyclotransferase family protein [Brevinema andersonii]